MFCKKIENFIESLDILLKQAYIKQIDIYS